jgi:4-diphosphocytidyl-2-C-methyl-D-erythritol kinase
VKEDTLSSPVLTVKAPAKINLFLRIVGRRPGGYHEIESFMQKVELSDQLHFSAGDDGISLACPGTDLPEDDGNLVFQAAQLFFKTIGKRPGVRIVLEKNIPVAAGLGGGSSDAAAALHGLNNLFGAGLSHEQLLEMARPLGADVPFFVASHSAAMASGIGDCLQGAVPLTDVWILLVNPGFPVSTKWVYENLPLTSNSNPYILARGRKLPEDFFSNLLALTAEQGNDLEEVTIKRYPQIGEIKETMKQAGAAAALMSGSGPTVFGLFLSEETATDSLGIFTRQYGKNVFLTKPYIP